MATTTYSSVAISPSPVLQTNTEVAANSPLLSIIPYAYTLLSLLGSLFSFSSTIIKLALSPLSVLFYIIAPITTFIDVTTTVFFRLPYRTFVYVAEALFPLYVLCGVACITGCIFGLGGRYAAATIMKYTLTERVGLSNRAQVDVKSREVKFE